MTFKRTFLRNALLPLILGIGTSYSVWAEPARTCDGVLFGSGYSDAATAKQIVDLLNQRLESARIAPEQMHFIVDESEFSAFLSHRDLSSFEWRKLIEATAKEFKDRSDSYMELRRDDEGEYLDHQVIRSTLSRLKKDWFTYGIGYLRSKGFGAIAVRRVSLARAVRNGALDQQSLGVVVKMEPGILIVPKDVRDLETYLRSDELVIVEANRRSSPKVKDRRTGILYIGLDDVVNQADAFRLNQSYSSQLIEEAEALAREEVAEAIRGIETVEMRKSQEKQGPPTLH